MDILLTYDNLAEAYDLVRYGHAGGSVADGIYGVRRAIPRVLAMLARHGLSATFFVEGWNAQKYPELVREIAAAGHEVAAHGWMHEPWETLQPEEERELIARTTGVLGDILGRPPVGWRSPAARTTRHTLSLLADNGYRYDSTFIDEDVPYRMHVRTGDERTLIELPMNGVLSDTPFYAHPATLRAPDEVHTLQWGELAGLAPEAAFAVITSHPRHTARPARLIAHERLITRLLSGELGEVHFLRADRAAEEYGRWDNLPNYPAPAEL
jgi:peptidoglycan/xylan/chitin deacetylase (PgdA/CDA1 family)